MGLLQRGLGLLKDQLGGIFSGFLLDFKSNTCLKYGPLVWAPSFFIKDFEPWVSAL